MVGNWQMTEAALFEFANALEPAKGRRETNREVKNAQISHTISSPKLL